MICKNCGHEDLSGAAFCPKCGEKLQESTVQAAPVSVAAPAPKKNTAKIIIIVAVIVALLAGAGVVTYFGFFAEDPWFVEGKADDGGADKKEDEDHSEDAKAAVEELMDAVVDYDTDAIEETLDIECVDIEAYLSDVEDSLGEMAPMYEPAFDAIVEGYFGSYKYEIGEIKEENGKYTVAVTFSCVNMDEANAAINELDGEAIGAEIMQDLIDSGKITEDMSEEEMMAVAMDDMADAFKEVVEETIKSADIKTYDLEFVVVEKDGEWVIDADASDYEGLKEEIESIGD